ncbi:HpaR: homoprotocatechuate degradation operon regulator, HpaR [compost metagenome]
MNVAQYSLLKHLARLDQPSITSLAEAMGLDRSTLGRNLKVLEAKGLVQLDGGEDQRNRLVSLTPAGRLVLEQALQAWEQVQQDMGQRIGPEKRAALMALLDDLEHIA